MGIQGSYRVLSLELDCNDNCADLAPFVLQNTAISTSHGENGSTILLLSLVSTRVLVCRKPVVHLACDGGETLSWQSLRFDPPGKEDGRRGTAWRDFRRPPGAWLVACGVPELARTEIQQYLSTGDIEHQKCCRAVAGGHRPQLSAHSGCSLIAMSDLAASLIVSPSHRARQGLGDHSSRPAPPQSSSVAAGRRATGRPPQEGPCRTWGRVLRLPDLSSIHATSRLR